MSFVQALGWVGLSERHSVYWAGRATLISDPEDIELYNRAFEVFWERKRPSGLDVELPAISVSIATDSDEDAADVDPQIDEDHGPTLQLRYSPTETLKDKDFAECDEQELDELRRLMGSLRFTSSLRPSRRR